jgi:DNA-binding transcriptional LysR family regulator
MELRHLKYFVAVAEALSFTKAAVQLRLAQPSLTRQIANLEKEIGVQLLRRSKTQVSLTEEGRSFLTDARRMLALAAESVRSIQELSQGDSGELNLAYLSNFNFEMLPQSLANFREACPQVAVNLFDMSPAEQLRALEGRKIDLGFIGLRPPSASKELQWECISHHEVMVFLPVKHDLARKKSIRLEDLRSEFFVTMSERTHPGFQEWLYQTCAPAGYTPRVLQGVELEAGLMTVVAEGFGITLGRKQVHVMPRPGVVCRPLVPTVRTDHCMAWNQTNTSKALLKFISIIKEITNAQPRFR